MEASDTEPKPGDAPERRAQGPGAETAVELDDLSRSFGDRVALAGVSAELPSGATMAVLGRNGSGKTTLLRILAGLLRPSGGQGRVLGAEIPGGLWRVRGRVGYLGHRPLLYRDLSAIENLAFSGRLHGMAPDRAASRAADLLAAMDMDRRADERIATFSAGMARRVDICRAVLHEPDLLLLDEPEANLDSAALELAEPLIGPNSGRARVVASHDRARALRGATLVLEMA